MKRNDKIFVNRIVTLDSLIKYINSVKKVSLKAINNRVLGEEIKGILCKYNFSIYELCYRIKNNIPFDKIFQCKQCEKQVFFGHIGHLGYRDYCSKKCSALATSNMEDVKKKREQTMLKRFGAKNYMATKEFQDNKETNMLKKYGAKNYTQTHEFKDFLKKHKDEFIFKAKQTCLEKYGTDSYTKTDEYKNNYDKVKEKMKATCLKKYGVDNYNKTQEYKNKYKNKEYLAKVQNKIYLTKKQNNSFNTSFDEEIIYKYLVDKYNKENIIRQYKSKEYPFHCDFYVKPLNLFIEYNGFWTHGKDSHNNILGYFNKEDKQHIKVLHEWEEKAQTSILYKNAIKTWTQRDPIKLETAKRNNLKYLVFWNMKEFNRWYKNV